MALKLAIYVFRRKKNEEMRIVANINILQIPN